jgi:hypothetical protein
MCDVANENNWQKMLFTSSPRRAAEAGKSDEIARIQELRSSILVE